MLKMNPNTVTPSQPHPELLQYIQAELAQGYTIDQIAIAARTAGWGDQQIKICIDWINNDYANRQMSVAQTYASNAQYVNSRPPSLSRRLLGIFGSLFIVAAILIASFLIYSGLTTKTSDALQPMVQKNLTQTSLQKTLTTKFGKDGGSLTAVCRCDFSLPAEPKAEIQIDITYPIESTRNATNQILIKAESIVIGDTAWVRLNDAQIIIDDVTRSSFADKTESGETTDDAIKAYYDIQDVGYWSQHFGFTTFTGGTSDGSLHSTLLPYIYGMATVFNDFLIGNFGTQAATVQSNIETLDVYKVTALSRGAESFNGVPTTVYDISINREAYERLASELDTTFKFSERHLEQLKNNTYTGLIGDFKAWSDEQGKLYKVASLDSTTSIEYADHGAVYTIAPPESDTNLDNLKSIQEDLQRFPN